MNLRPIELELSPGVNNILDRIAYLQREYNEYFIKINRLMIMERDELSQEEQLKQSIEGRMSGLAVLRKQAEDHNESAIVYPFFIPARRVKWFDGYKAAFRKALTDAGYTYSDISIGGEPVDISRGSMYTMIIGWDYEATKELATKHNLTVQ